MTRQCHSRDSTDTETPEVSCNHGGMREVGMGQFDLAVVGAGILGLAAALAGVKRGLRVVVIDRDAQANGA